VSRTSERGIPFYFVRGNHDRPSGRRLLNRLADEYSNCSRLRKDPVYLGTPRVLLYGVDHVGGDLPEIHRKPTFRILPFPTILVIHETPYPVVNDNGDLTHKQNGPNLEVFLTNSTLEPDLIISGHMHVWSRGIVRDHQVPVLVPGPTAPISTYKKDNTPSTWLVTARNGGLEIEQHPL
jgi:DNA repair exonuclease SbcCD nuclease subunit